ncbi:hypothetical protein HED63_02930 [Ochrobactrum cytisi]|nr:hypothetical protein [Brucella cytisi]
MIVAGYDGDDIAIGQVVVIVDDRLKKIDILVTARLLPPVEARPRDVRHVFSDVINDVS